ISLTAEGQYALQPWRTHRFPTPNKVAIMNAPPLVVGWKEVRNHELSDIITRRLAVGLLTPARVRTYAESWVHDCGGADGGSAKLASILEEWLDIGLLTPEALQATIGRWQEFRPNTSQVNVPPPTLDQCATLLQKQLFVDLAAILTPRDLRDGALAL